MLREKKADNFRISESKKVVEKELKQQTTLLQEKQIQSATIQVQQENCCSTSTQSSQHLSVSQEGQTETDPEQKQYEKRLNEYLPRKIGGINIKRVEWSDFPGKADPSMSYWAHIYWQIKYNYSIEERERNGNNSNGRYYKVINANVNVLITNKSWVRNQTPYLLSHEQGHYLIASLCALEFKQQLMHKKFTLNYSNEINLIFNNTLKHFSNMEIRYDQETNHSKHFQKQTQWFIFLYDQLKKYEEKFFSVSKPRSSNFLKNINDNKENQALNSNQMPLTSQRKSMLPPIQKPSASLSRVNGELIKQSLDRQDSRMRRNSQIQISQKD